MTDSLVRCRKCCNQKPVRFADGLARGWPECCGETMTLIHTTVNVRHEADQQLTGQTKFLRQLLTITRAARRARR